MPRRRPSVLMLALSCLSAPIAPAAGDSVPVGGLEALHSWPEDSGNFLRNASFEAAAGTSRQPRSWTLGQPSHAYRDNARAHAGAWSLRFRDAHRASATPAAVQPVTLAPGWYTLRGWARAYRAGANDPNAGGRIVLEGSGSTGVLRGTTPWTKLEVRDLLVEPAGEPQVRVEAFRKPSGNVFFDDLQLRRLVPPAVEGFLLYPNYRGVLFEDAPQTVRVQVTARPAEVGLSRSAMRVELSLETADGALVARRVISTPAAPVAVALDAARAPLGRLRLRVRARRASDGRVVFEYPAYALQKLPASARQELRFYVDADGAAVLAGERRFVLGIYDTSGSSADPDYYEPRISAIAEAPFNLYLNYWLGGASDAALRALTSVLARHGMAYLHTVNRWYAAWSGWRSLPSCQGRTAAEMGEEAYWACRAQALGEDGGLAGWYTADEQPASQAASAFRQYRALRQAHPGGLAFVAQNEAAELERWRDAADVFDVHTYPIYRAPEGTVSPLEKVRLQVEGAQAALAHSRPVWAVIQYFAHGSGSHFPTYDELRSMSYMAIVAGAKGLFYWSYGAAGLSYVGDPVERHQHWQDLVRLTREIHGLEPALLGPEDPGSVVAVSAPQVKWRALRANGMRYLIAVNDTARSGVAATFTLAAPASSVEVVGESRFATAAGDRVRDVFGPYEAHVYRIR